MEPTVYTTLTPWYKRKLLWGFLLVLILIPIGAWIYATYFMKSPASPASAPAASENTLKEDNSPVAFDILLNPMVYEWRGSVEGILIAKDDKYIVLEKGDQKITISIDLNPNYTGTKFFKGTPAKDPKANFISLDDIPVGTKLRGDFFIFAHRKNELIGSSFEVLD